MGRNNKTIDHEGVVKSITPSVISVEILNKSMCAACHAKSACTMSDMSIKTINVPNLQNESYEVGEEVLIVMKKTLGLRAVWISYVIPLIILMRFSCVIPLLNNPKIVNGSISLNILSFSSFGSFMSIVV